MVKMTTGRRGTARLLIVLAGLIGATSTPRADTMHAHYSVSLVGLRIGDIYADTSVEAKTYRIGLNAQLSGFAAMVNGVKLALASSGSVKKSKLAPMNYATSSVNESETRTLRMALKSGTVKAVEIMPPPEFHGERVPVTDANKRNILDPTSALIMPVAANERLDGPAACDRTLPVYDGYARFDVSLHYAGTRDVAVPGYSGPVAICTARYHPISGHYVNSRSTAFMAQNTGIELWLAPVGTDHVVIPFRVSLPTMTGQLDIEAVEFEAMSSGGEAATH